MNVLALLGSCLLLISVWPISVKHGLEVHAKLCWLGAVQCDDLLVLCMGATVLSAREVMVKATSPIERLGCLRHLLPLVR